MKNQNDNHCTVKIPVLHFIYLSVYYLFHFWIGIKVKHRNDNHCSVKIPVLHLIYLSMYYLFFVPCFCQQRIQIGGADYLIGRFLSSEFSVMCLMSILACILVHVLSVPVHSILIGIPEYFVIHI